MTTRPARCTDRLPTHDRPTLTSTTWTQPDEDPHDEGDR